LWGVVPTAPAQVDAASGTLDARVGGAGLAAFYAALPASSRAFVDVGLGAGVIVVAASGTPASSEAAAASSIAACFLPHATSTLGVRVTPWLALRADGVLGLARPEPVLRALGEPVASFGEPMVVADVALEVRP
ncbi:MAG TPA: hypothetical protein VHB21_26315, partial [Minicystis sp.]|nr:hypothetical protein [Minicystis sp.]